jgi:hypothetical protein
MKTLFRVAVMAAFVFVSVHSAHAADGELCFVSRRTPDCRTVIGERFRVAPAATARPFFWWNAERTDLAVGTLPAGGEAVTLAEWRRIPVLLEGDDPQSWPQPVTIRLNGVETIVGARAAATLRRLRVESGQGTLELSAPHHRPVVRPLNGPVSIRFARYPALSGTVIDSVTRAPAAGVSVLLPTSELLATTATDGRFVADVTADWPAHLRIEAPQRAARILELPQAMQSFDIGVVELSRGGTLRVVLDRDEPVMLAVTRRSRPVAERRNVHGAVEISGLAPGAYDLSIRGAAPLQRLTTPIEIREGATTETAPEIRPVELLVRVRAGERAVGGARVAIGPASGAWEAILLTGEDGMTRNELWERGEFGAFVTAEGIDAFDHRRLAGSSDIEWVIEAPAGRVTGVVRDAEGGAPIRGARVLLESDTAQAAAESDAAGRFAFANVETSSQTLTVDARGYVRVSRSFRADEAEELTIRLEHALEQTFAISLANGRPAAKALLVDAATMQQHVADDEGMVTLGFRAGEQKTLYVLPREGSFAAIDATAPRGASVPQRVVVPAGDATVVIHARSTAGQPLPGIRFAVRFNGRIVTEAARNALHQQLGFPFATGADGTAMLRNVPAGLYELWPYADAGERNAIEWGIGPPPVSLAARAGVNDVILTFTK